MTRSFRVRDQLVNGLLGEELAGQKGLLKRRDVPQELKGHAAQRRKFNAPLRHHK